MSHSVYCNTCMTKIPVTVSGDYKCANPKCYLKYHFRVFSTSEEARDAYLELESWAPKFYFPTRNETGQPSGQWCVAWNNQPVEPLVPTTITELIEPDAIRLMEVGLAREFEGPLSVIEATGTRIENLDLSIPFMCSNYCRIIRSCHRDGFDGNDECIRFDLSIHKVILSGKAPDNLIIYRDFEYERHVFRVYAYFCWAGMVDYACAVQIYGRTIAVVFAGQRRLLGKAPNGLCGEEQLMLGINAATTRLKLDQSDLITSKEDNPVVTVDEIYENELPKVFAVARKVFDLAFERYRRRRDETEHCFREEATYLLQTERDTYYGVKRVDKILHRLKEFLRINEAYFLLNDIHELDTYEIVAKATSENLTRQESDLRIIFNEGELSTKDRITVFELTGNPDYEKAAQSFNTQLGYNARPRIWAITCPLGGMTNGFWLLVNPQPVPGIRPESTLTRLDTHFVSRFASNARETLSTAFATALVMRKLNHELGSALDKIFKREIEVAEGQVTGDMAKTYAKRNICQLWRYSYLLENVHCLFVRRSQRTYEFKLENIQTIIDEVCMSFDGDPDMAARNVELQPPIMRGRTMISLDEDLIKIALFNLIQNAIKYSFDNHYIHIHSRELPAVREIEIKIANFGVKIEPFEIDRRLIFMEEYRGVWSQDRYRTGAGLGLAIAERIINNHSGRIAAACIDSGDLERRKSEYNATISEPYLQGVTKPTRKDGSLSQGSLTFFTVYLPFGT